jgi:hypothetical protein
MDGNVGHDGVPHHLLAQLIPVGRSAQAG